MPKLTLTDLTNLQNEQTVVNAINNNNTAIENAIELTLTRTGAAPNFMAADLDMDSKRILNLPDALTDKEPVTKGFFDDTIEALKAGAVLTASYVTLGTNAQLTNERVLTGGNHITIADSGAGSAVTVNVNETTLNADVATLTNKTVALGSNTISGTTAEFNTALTDNNFATQAGSETLTNKTISLGSNTVSGTTAQFNTALTDNDFATLAGTETLTNKTVNLTSNTLTGTIAQFNAALSNGDFAPSVTTRTALKALDTTTITITHLTESGREGLFTWKTGNYSSQIAADTREGVYIKADAIAATSGAWVRVHTEGVYDVKWFGALGDVSTNDYAAIQGCIDFTEATGGGTVLVSEGGYVVNTGLVVDTALVRLAGVGCRFSSIRSSVANLNLVTLNAARCAVTNLSLFHSTVRSTSDSAILTFGANAVQCTASDLDMVGGYYGIRASLGSADNIIENVVARQTFGGAIVYCQGAGTPFFRRCLFNNDWPVVTPAQGGSNDRGAHATSTAYALNDFVTLSGFILQCKTAGTSGGAAPSLTGVLYDQDITDGTAVWRIANNASGVAVFVDTGCLYATFEDCDFTGAFVKGAYVANGLGGERPDEIRFFQCTTGGVTTYGFHIDSAETITIDNCEAQVAVNNGTSIGIQIDTNFIGDAKILHSRVTSGFDIGINIGHNTVTQGSVLVTGNQIFGLPQGITVGPGRNNFQIIDNNLGTSQTWGTNTTGITVTAGSSDNYIIFGNRLNGVATPLSDNGTGTNKVVTQNGAALTKTDDTNVTLTLGGAPTKALLAATSITVGWNGTLAETRGGTGQSTFTQGDILYSSAANTLAKLAKNTGATRYLSNTGTDNNPAWSQINLANGVTGTLPNANVATVPCFSVHKNGTDQTGIADSTFTEVTFGTEDYDVGGHFASNAWTPPAGKVTLTAALLASGTWSAGAQIAIAIYKNGLILKQANWFSAAANQGAAFIGCDDIANGTDVYSVRVYVDVGSGTATVSGTSNNTYFCGHWISP